MNVELFSISASIAVAIFRVNMMNIYSLTLQLASFELILIIFALNMATAVFAEMLDSCQHSTSLIPEGRSLTLNSSYKT
jgi:hypothetical protein